LRSQIPTGREVLELSVQGPLVQKPVAISPLREYSRRRGPHCYHSRHLALTPGSRLGPYEVTALLVGAQTPSVFLRTPFREGYGVFSPDGRWVAYQTNESGRPEVYARPFLPPGATSTGAVAGAQWQVSTAGGIHPAWRPDGKELYYLNPAGVMMAAPVAVSGATLELGAPVELFPTQVMGSGVDIQQGRQYDVAPGGRFLINTVLDNTAPPIALLMNWNPAR